MDKKSWNKRNFRDQRYLSKRKIHQNWKIKKRKVEIDHPNQEYCDAGANKEDQDEHFYDESIYDDVDEEEDPIEEKFQREDALNVISSVFVYNNISSSLGQDIFSISKLLKEFPSITISDVMKRVDKWSQHENRIYTKCSSCSQILSQQNKCRNEECVRNGKSQTNLAGGTKLLTFSIKNQLKEILETGNFGLENREFHLSSLSKKLSTTPKYLSRLRQARIDYPSATTMFITINMDGFRKRGMSRGEYWPLYVAANDLSTNECAFSEYRPELVMLSSMIHSSIH